MASMTTRMSSTSAGRVAAVAQRTPLAARSSNLTVGVPAVPTGVALMRAFLNSSDAARFRTLPTSLMMARLCASWVSNLDRRSSFSVYGMELPYSVAIAADWLVLKPVLGNGRFSSSGPPSVSTFRNLLKRSVSPRLAPNEESRSQNWRNRMIGCAWMCMSRDSSWFDQ